MIEETENGFVIKLNNCQQTFTKVKNGKAYRFACTCGHSARQHDYIPNATLAESCPCGCEPLNWVYIDARHKDGFW